MPHSKIHAIQSGLSIDLNFLKVRQFYIYPVNVTIPKMDASEIVLKEISETFKIVFCYNTLKIFLESHLSDDSNI